MYFELRVPRTILEEMDAQRFVWVKGVNVSQMFIESIFEFSEGLPYILFKAVLAS